MAYHPKWCGDDRVALDILTLLQKINCTTYVTPLSHIKDTKSVFINFPLQIKNIFVE
jgi:hypothetical protein